MSSDSTLTSPALAGPLGELPPKTVIAARFNVEALAGRGGMGAVYRAMDTQSGRRVGLKLMHGLTSPEAAYRFKREAVLLEELCHPAIVGYVAHGVTEAGQPFLAMEWLEGEDLARRLARQPLTPLESLALLRRAAEALASAHQQGIVHRDLKPSNLFLREGRPEDVVVLDFGLARHVVPTVMAVTGSHGVVGTPGYMAPEQASSQQDITASADVFSLGCVLYECLTGKPPFAAPHLAAALAKILFAEPAPLHTVREGLPQSLQALLDRMLAKDPKRRLPDAPRLLEALAALPSMPELLPLPAVEARAPMLEGSGQQLVSVLLMSPPVAAPTPPEAGGAPGLALRDAARRELAPFGAQVELLAEGSLVATLLPTQGTATDQATLAARCALVLKEHWPHTRVVLVTGRGTLHAGLPVGEAMDRAGRLLHLLEQRPESTSVMLDEVTAGLLGSGFQLSRPESSAFLLHGNQLGMDASRPLLGKPTPCVGREQELAMLELALTACVEEPAVQAVLVTGPAGGGKSRLRHEFLLRLEQRGQPVRVLLGRGDPMRTGAACSLLGQALRSFCGLQGGEAPAVRRERLVQRLTRHLPVEQAPEVVEFLGELCGLSPAEEDSPRLRAARNDPHLMRAWMGRALVSFLRAECRQGLVLLVLEDLHWSDALTVKLVDEVLRELAECPLLVLALARPEVRGAFPELWAGRLQEVSLRGLSRKASAQLVHEVLGPRVPQALLSRILEQAAGNALFLEELIRLAAEGRAEDSPETVLAMLQARLLQLGVEARQVLLAASFFGRTFWLGGVRALLGGQLAGPELRRQLEQLVKLEIIEPQPDSRFPAESEYRFRHALVRDAAHGLVPERDKALGHRLAGAWLEQVEEPDTLVLAEHYQQGGQVERALAYYVRAAEHLAERGDLEGSQRCVEAAQACGAPGGYRSRLRALQTSLSLWRNDFAALRTLGDEALPELEPGSLSWCRLMGTLMTASTLSGAVQKTVALRELMLSTTPVPGAVSLYVESLVYVYIQNLWQGAPGLEPCFQHILRVGTPCMDREPLVRGWMGFAQGYRLLRSQPWEAQRMADQCVQAFREVGSERILVAGLVLAGLTRAVLGAPQEAVALMEEALAAGQRGRQQLSLAYAHLMLNLLLASSSEQALRERASAFARERVSAAGVNLMGRGVAHYVLARVAEGRGELAEAEAHGRQACELLVSMPAYQLLASTTLSASLLALGRVSEAREVAGRAVQVLERPGDFFSMNGAAVRLALAEACFAQGDSPAGEEALRRAVQEVRAQAGDIPDAAARQRFLAQVPENARVLELARQRWGEP
jgi:tetratricopeptide (TPR) repeat protein